MESIDHTTGVIKTLENGGAEEVEMLLSSSFQLRRSGVIRPGIMVLKSGCSEQDNAIYNEMVRKGADWDEIEKRLKTDKAGKDKLVPKNVDYFTIHPKDCVNPADAETIHRLYADADGKLRSFPVWFPVNEWWKIIPHSLRCFGSTHGLKYKGSIRDGEMVCEYRTDQKKAKKAFRGEGWAERPCNPEGCSEFQSGACKFGGTINFYIPGIKGLGIWVIPTTSIYSMISIKSALEMVSHMPGGRVAGLFGGKPMFKIRKVLATRYRRELDGTKKKTQQWEIALDSDIDLTEIAAAIEPSRTLVRGKTAAALLEGEGKRHTNQPEKTLEKPSAILPAETSPAEKTADIVTDAPKGLGWPDKEEQIGNQTVIEGKKGDVSLPVEMTGSDQQPAAAQAAKNIGEPQKNAIRKVALKQGIEKVDIEKIIADLKGPDEAGKLIMQLQRGEHIEALEALR